jgi:hypothetical protein
VTQDRGELTESVNFASRHHWANGVYILGWNLYSDRVVLRLFTSRRVSTEELVERLAPFDAAGTEFVAIPQGRTTSTGKVPSGITRRLVMACLVSDSETRAGAML